MTTFKKIGSLMAIIAIALVCLVAFSSCVITPDEPTCKCVDADSDHACDSCGNILSECADVDGNHLCDECEKALSECADNDNDHYCDLCCDEMSVCTDENGDHTCDMCGETASECADNDKDHYCDLCYAPLTKCTDDNKDHNCDICGIVVSQCYDGNKDHVCEYCNGNVGEHADSDLSDGHLCNYCGESLCEDGDDEDHNCDTCTANLCADADSNCLCDGCCAVLCIDINPLDHNCDNCGKLFSECSDGDDSNHDCDICFANLCKDGDDEDHNCDGCGVNLCVDADNNHYCDGCEKPLCIDSNDRGHNCDVCGLNLCADGNDEDHNCDVCGAIMCYDVNEDGKCEECGNLVPTIIVYVEGANCKINGAEFVHGYGESVDIVPTYHASQYVIDLWIVYDQTGTKIAYIENGVAYTISGTGTYYIAPIFIANNLSGIGDASTSVDVTDTNSAQINESVITPEWADVNADKKLFIFGSAGHTNNVLASAPNSQVYLTTDPQNAANIVLMHATRNAATGGIGNTVIETAFDADSKGEGYLMSFDYYLDHNCSNNDSTTTMSVVDENGVEYKIAVIVPKGKSMQNLLDTAVASENAFRFQSRHYNSTGAGITGNDGVSYKDSAGSESIYLYSDTWYTFTIKIEYNVIYTYWSLRGSDEIALVQEYDFSNFSISEKNLTSFKINVGLYNNSSIAYFDNIWFGRGHECVDSDNNHNCDVCEAPLCYDGIDADHNCDRCDVNLCYEGDIADHYCDVCSAVLSECADENKNHYCDICGATLSECTDGDDEDHNCDLCGKNFCEDVIPDHKCDVCGATISECADNDKDHKCEWCGATISECADGNNDHKCDTCGATLSECADENKDHKCDLCGTTTSQCVDEDNNFVCDFCGKTLCNDSNEDHLCDITDEHDCVWVKTECADLNHDHDCDLAGCDVRLGGDCADETGDHHCDYCYAVITACDKATVCSVCGKTVFQGDEIFSGDDLTVITSVSNTNKPLADKSNVYSTDTITTEGRPENYKYGTWISLGVDPEDSANQVLQFQINRVEGGGANAPSSVTATPTIVDENGKYTVMKFRMYIGTVSGSAKGYHDVLYLHMIDANGTEKKAIVGYRTSTTATNDAGETVYTLKSCGATINATTDMWIDMLLVNDAVEGKYYAYYSVDGGEIYTYANEGSTGLSGTVSAIRFDTNTYQVNGLALIDDLTNTQVDGLSILLSDGTTRIFGSGD